MENEIWMWLLPIILLPVFFAMGWFAARVDMRAVLKQAKTVPTDFYAGVDALVDKNTDVAVRAFGDVLAKQEDTQEAYELAVSMGKLYRNRGENDKAIAAKVGPFLREKGLVFVGLDVIGNYVTEINVTSPTCIREIDAQFGTSIADDLFAVLEAGRPN